MTVYNESEFIDYAIRSCLPHVDHLVVVEGAYQETIALGASPRSTDGTCEKLDNWKSMDDPEIKEVLGESLQSKEWCGKLYHIEANEQSDKDQRNVGLEKIKQLNPDGWLLIVDGDEVYESSTIKMIKICAHNMERQERLAAYFKSLTFVNDGQSFVEQHFPRLFKITPKCKFINDNHMDWPDKGTEGTEWYSSCVITVPYIKYHHYAFCKGSGERFKLKQKWWNTRFEKKSKFEYDWYVNKDNKIWSPNHKVHEYTGEHPEIMWNHPLIGKS